MPKTGRNPADFGKQVDINYGVRIYEGADATAPMEFPTVAEVITKPELKAYADQKADSDAAAAAPAAAQSIVVSFVALVAFMFSMF